MKSNILLYKSLTILLTLAFICGCQKIEKFTVEGVIAGAAGQMLYLDNTGLNTTTIIDSIKLKSNCKFSFSHSRPEDLDFYRLRLNNQDIHFSVDSTETITFTADAHNFSNSYTVEGSESSKALKEITLARADAAQELQKLRSSLGVNLIPDSTYQQSVEKVVATYKETAQKYIYGAPKSAAAYFALFQQIDGLWLFDLYDRMDSRAYGAVATSYKNYYPESPRSKQLEQLALQSLKIVRGERQKVLDLSNAKEINFIDIELPDINGKIVKLSEIAVGKTILVNFTAYQTEWSISLNAKISELYNKYKNNGLEVYQISLDSDSHYWKNAVSTIPWINVRDPQSVHSSIAAIYNVRQLPALFIINKKGEMVKRIETIDALENDIKQSL